jgi:hypothetical protein
MVADRDIIGVGLEAQDLKKQLAARNPIACLDACKRK